MGISDKVFTLRDQRTPRPSCQAGPQRRLENTCCAMGFRPASQSTLEEEERHAGPKLGGQPKSREATHGMCSGWRRGRLREGSDGREQKEHRQKEGEHLRTADESSESQACVLGKCRRRGEIPCSMCVEQRGKKATQDQEVTSTERRP